MKRALLVAFQFPPQAGTSGIQRALRFAQYLPEYRWSPMVLTAHPRAYEQTNYADVPVLPDTVSVHRAFALDAARHLSIAGRYPGFLARPDRWISWWLGAVPLGLWLIKKHRPSVIWSTYPLATSHVVAHTLAKLSGVPWVADFRDPMAHDGYPHDPVLWRHFESIEQKVFRLAHSACFTTAGMLRLYQERYGWADERMSLIENGFDETDFRLSATRMPLDAVDDQRRMLLHSGIVYPEWRSPRKLFQALRRLLDQGHPFAQQALLRFRAPVHGDFVTALAVAEGVSAHVEVMPPLDYLDALREMLHAGGLLLLQSAGCNDQVPAKTYEYLHTGRPIIALTDPHGETARVMQRHPAHLLADLESLEQTEAALSSWLLDRNDATGTDERSAMADRYSRRAQTGQLAAVFDRVSSV